MFQPGTTPPPPPSTRRYRSPPRDLPDQTPKGVRENARENIFHAEGRCAAFAAWKSNTRHSFTTIIWASSSKTNANSSRISSGFARRPKQEQT